MTSAGNPNVSKLILLTFTITFAESLAITTELLVGVFSEIFSSFLHENNIIKEATIINFFIRTFFILYLIFNLGTFRAAPSLETIKQLKIHHDHQYLLTDPVEIVFQLRKAFFLGGNILFPKNLLRYKTD